MCQSDVNHSIATGFKVLSADHYPGYIESLTNCVRDSNLDEELKINYIYERRGSKILLYSPVNEGPRNAGRDSLQLYQLGHPPSHRAFIQ